MTAPRGITDELRMFIKDPLLGYASQDQHIERLTEIADRIDAEHEKAMSRASQLLADAEKDRDYNYANWQDCKQKVLQHNITINELDARIECLEDELSHCIELPKDADGEYIHIGDRVENNERVVRIVLADGSWGPSVYVEESYNVLHEYFCDEISHYHAPTVENVLRDFTYAILNQKACYREQNIAEYAAKLRLADDGMEQ